MVTEQKRLTFTVTKEMESLLNRVKKDMFYDCNRSDMIRALVTEGLDSLDNKAAKKDR